MTSRLLPRADWPRLAGTELAEVWPVLDADARILVVEEAETIVGCWAIVRYVHLEGGWIHPAHRKRGAVLRHALARMVREVRALGGRTILTAALTDEVRQIVTGLGGVRLPGDHYVVPLGAVPCRR